MKNTTTLMIAALLSFPFLLSGQDLLFSFQVVPVSSSASNVQIFVQKSGSGTENLAGYTVDFYYNNAESTLTSFDFSPTTVLGWDVGDDDELHTPDNNGAVSIAHTGFGTINVIDEDFNGTDIGTAPVHILTIMFDHSAGTSAASEGFLASTSDNRPALAYTNFNFDEHPVNVTGAQFQPLPIELASFTAKPLNATDAVLDWVTAGELNSSHFEVERSSDGQRWEQVGAVGAAGNSQAVLEYRLVDEKVFDPLLMPSTLFYYRLKMLDLDGTFEYSDVRSVEFEGRGGMAVGEPFPNPSRRGHVDVQLPISVEVPLEVGITVYDVQGRNVGLLQRSVGPGEQLLELDLGMLSAGVYHLRIQVGNERFARKLVVQ